MAIDTTSDQQLTATFEHQYADAEGSNQALEQAQFNVTRQAKLLQKAEMLAELAAWEWDIVNDTWHMSPNWCRIHGVSKAPATFAQRILFAHPQDREHVETALRYALAEASVASVGWVERPWNRAKDGTLMLMGRETHRLQFAKAWAHDGFRGR